MRYSLVLLALALALSACGYDPNRCTRHSDCKFGLQCTPTGLCALPPPDPDATTDAVVDGAGDANADAATDASTDAATDAGTDAPGDASVGDAVLPTPTIAP